MRMYPAAVLKTKLLRRKKRKKILGVVWWIIAAFLAVCAAIVIYQRYIKKDNGVYLFGYTAYVVLSGSMHPAIEVGDIVVVSRADQSELSAKDIVTFTDGDGNTVTHRIIEVVVSDGVRYYKTKGDGNNAADVGLITYNDIKGKYRFKLGGAGFIVDAVFTPLGAVLLATLISLILFNSSRLNDRRIARHIIRERCDNQNATKKKEQD